MSAQIRLCEGGTLPRVSRTVWGVVELSCTPAARKSSGCQSTFVKPIRNGQDEALAHSFPSRSAPRYSEFLSYCHQPGNFQVGAEAPVANERPGNGLGTARPSGDP